MLTFLSLSLPLLTSIGMKKRRRRNVGKKTEKEERTIHSEYVFERVAFKTKVNIASSQIHTHTRVQPEREREEVSESKWQVPKHTRREREKKELYFLTKLASLIKHIMLLLLFTDSWRASDWCERRRMWNIVMRDRPSSSPVDLSSRQRKWPQQRRQMLMVSNEKRERGRIDCLYN